MKPIPIRGLALTFLLAGALTLTACSDTTAPEVDDPGTGEPAGYPPVPKPAAVDDFDQPDQSEIYETIAPLAGKDVDFAPTWSAGTFTWDIDIQTTWEELTVWGWEPGEDPASGYWSGTRHNSGLVFEGGIVDLRAPYGKPSYLLHEPAPTARGGMPRRLMLMENGVVLTEPYNPKVSTSQCYFDFGPDYGIPDVRFDPGVFVGVWDLDVENGFNQRHKRRVYHVAATAAPALTNPVFMKRERFWERVLVDDTKSVRVDPGFTKSVTYTRTSGTSYDDSYTFASTLEVTASVAPANIGGIISDSTTETFSHSRSITEEESTAVTHEVSGIEGKTIIFSVWQSVERYSFVDENGDPYTDPGYTFTDLGDTAVRGDHEILQSAIFAHE